MRATPAGTYPRLTGLPVPSSKLSRTGHQVDRCSVLRRHPHQLRHTLATQFRGMSLEAIAALLGHRSLDMTVRYAKIANRTVSEEYFAVADQVDALHTTPPSASTATGCPGVTRLHRDQGRMLGNGWCARPAELDCGYETICESCDFFTIDHGFQPILQAQHDDAAAKAQLSRQELFAQLLTGLNQDVS